ncbi:hypothetical protein MSG28_010030 [Choristoneura fumiferana]|uniref:Uncharacterized protein n=1 Tax=Choristoneura fumiferana TaxID=7141 RepID=A0ACC0KIY3_CHOFU|nr:hypothetical protein MSG28_010030 [Choristoneura fumiferana]
MNKGSGRSEMELESQALALPMPRGEDAEMPDSLTLALAIDSSPPTSLPTDYDVSSPEWSVSLRDPSPLSAADPQPSNTQVQLHQAADDSIPVNESIISLLLKLHSQLSGRLDSFSLDEPEPQSDEPIGDGPHFIGQVLRKLARLDARCAAAIDHVRHSLWPHQGAAGGTTDQRREKEERSRRARERQQQLMKEFQRRQQQFLHCMQRLSPEPMELDAPAPAPAPAPATTTASSATPAPSARRTTPSAASCCQVALNATLHERAPKEETLLTLLLEAEAIVNSRPLSHVSIESDEEETLTPFHFLIGSSSNQSLPGGMDDTDLLRRAEWRKALRLADHFWERWVKEVLPTMQPRQTTSENRNVNLKIGDIVIIVDENLPRGTWPRGRVAKLFPGKDGVVRVVDVATAGGLLRRPTRKLVRIAT